MKILYEDQDIIAVHKNSGLATQTSKIGEKDLYSEVKNYLKGGYAGIINRLDQPVEGVVIFAKNKKSAGMLEEQIKHGDTNKFYHATVYVPNEKKLLTNDAVSLENYMRKKVGTNLSEICGKEDKDAKLAKLEYIVMSTNQGSAKLDIHLLTGRHHQIRLQLSNSGFPILGDLKYGTEESISYSKDNGIKSVALCAYRYEFIHPSTNKKMSISI